MAGFVGSGDADEIDHFLEWGDIAALDLAVEDGRVIDSLGLDIGIGGAEEAIADALE